MVTIQDQQEEVFPDKQKQETLPWGLMGCHSHSHHSQHFRWKQSCCHSGFGVILNVTVSSSLGEYSEAQGHLSGAGLSFPPNSILELTDRAPPRLCSFCSTRLSPAPNRSSAADTARVGAQKELKPKSELCPSPESLLPQGTSQRGAWDAPSPAKQRDFSGNSPGDPCQEIKVPPLAPADPLQGKRRWFPEPQLHLEYKLFSLALLQPSKGESTMLIIRLPEKVFPPAERERSCSRQGTTSIIYILHHH